LAEGVARRFGFIAGQLDTMDDMRHYGAPAAASVALRVPSAALKRLVAIVQGRASFPNVGSEAFVRLMLAADELAAEDLVGRFVGAVADSIRGKTVEQVKALFAGVSELTEDLVHKVLDRMPLSAAVMLCEEWVARSAAGGGAAFMDAGTASRKACALALDAQRAVQPFALQTPVTEEHVRAAEALIAEHGARGADCVHRALEAFADAPGGRVLRASDLRHCIRIRAAADAQLGPWMVASYAASRDQAPAVNSVVSAARERVRRVVHIEGPSGSGKTEVSTSIYANVARTVHGRLLEERKRKRPPATANVLYLTNTNILKDTWNKDVGVPEADRAPTKPGRSVKSFIYEVYQKRNRLQTSQIAIATSAAKVSPVNHPLLGRVSAAEIWA
jgi:hypothetical protein